MNDSINRSRSGKVTEASVAEAARKLLEAGQTPTLAAVLQILGGGSQNLASRLLREWKERQPKVRAAEFQVDPRISELIAEQLSSVSKLLPALQRLALSKLRNRSNSARVRHRSCKKRSSASMAHWQACRTSISSKADWSRRCAAKSRTCAQMPKSRSPW